MQKCSHCEGSEFWILGTGQKRCKQCGLTGFPIRTCWQLHQLSPHWKGSLLEYFCLDVPAYRLRFQVPISQKGIQRWYRIMRVCIYQDFPLHLTELSGEIELDKTMFGG